MKWLVIIAVVLGAGVAHAGSQGIVLESYTRDRPAAAQKPIATLLGELSQRGFTTGADVGNRFEGQVSRPAGGASDLPPKFGDQVAAGLRAWASGKFEDAISAVQPLVTAAHESPGAFIGAPKLGDSLQTALIVLALSQQRMGDPGAQATWTELVRSFPAATVSKSTFGPDAEKQFAQVKTAVANAQKGHLLVQVDDQSSDIYINERLDHRGTTAKDVLPGDYRIVVQLGSKRSRAHRVTIAAGQDVRIVVDPVFDDAVVTTGWAGFQFATTAAHGSEGVYAADFAKSIQADSVVVVGVDSGQLVGSVFLFNGKATKRASIALDASATPEKIAQLAGFLVGEKVTTTGINIDLDTAPPPPAGSGDTGAKPGPIVTGPAPPRDESPHHRWGGWPVLTGVVALGLGGYGGYLLYKDGKCKDGTNDPNCPAVFNNKGPGFGCLGGAALFAGITVYLIVTRPHDDKPAKTVSLVPADGGAMATLGGTW